MDDVCISLKDKLYEIVQGLFVFLATDFEVDWDERPFGLSESIIYKNALTKIHQEVRNQCIDINITPLEFALRVAFLKKNNDNNILSLLLMESRLPRAIFTKPTNFLNKMWILMQSCILVEDTNNHELALNEIVPSDQTNNFVDLCMMFPSRTLLNMMLREEVYLNGKIFDLIFSVYKYGIFDIAFFCHDDDVFMKKFEEKLQDISTKLSCQQKTTKLAFSVTPLNCYNRFFSVLLDCCEKTKNEIDFLLAIRSIFYSAEHLNSLRDRVVFLQIECVGDRNFDKDKELEFLKEHVQFEKNIYIYFLYTLWVIKLNRCSTKKKI